MNKRLLSLIFASAVLYIASNELSARDPQVYARQLSHQSESHAAALTSGEDLAVGDLAPDLIANNAKGVRFRTQPLAGRKTAILFLTACGSCVDDCLRTWDRLRRAHPDTTVIVISEAPSGQLSEAAEKIKVSIPILYDPQMTSARAYRIKWGPRAYLINEMGRLEFVQSRMLSCRELEQQLKTLDAEGGSDAGRKR